MQIVSAVFCIVSIFSFKKINHDYRYTEGASKPKELLLAAIVPPAAIVLFYALGTPALLTGNRFGGLNINAYSAIAVSAFWLAIVTLQSASIEQAYNRNPDNTYKFLHQPLYVITFGLGYALTGIYFVLFLYLLVQRARD